MKIEYAIIVKNKTRLEQLVERFNTRDQARFYIERQGGDFDDYVREHDRFHESLTMVQSRLSTILKNKIVERSFVSSFIFSANQVIVVIGQDGLVANTAKYSRNIPIIAINPDRERYDGVLLPYDPTDFEIGVRQVANNQYKADVVRFAEAKLNDGQRLLAFNDLFIGPASHVSARYRITTQNRSEEQSSSGIIVSTRAGSTGWLSSIFNMAKGLNELTEPGHGFSPPAVARDQLIYTVREPFLSVRTQVGICAGIIDHEHLLTIESLMPNHGIIFSDGVESDYLKFNSGTIAQVGLAMETATLVMP